MSLDMDIGTKLQSLQWALWLTLVLTVSCCVRPRPSSSSWTYWPYTTTYTTRPTLNCNDSILLDAYVHLLWNRV